MNPLVTIIIPTYNRATELRETLNSVAKQTFSDWECIIIDDHSTDDTLLMLAQYTAKDSRFQCITKPNNREKNAATSRNIGLENAKGTYIQFLDSDDLLAPNKLEVQINKLQKATDATIATCKWGFFESTQKPFELFQNCADYRDFDSPKAYLDLIGEHGGFYPLHCFLMHKEHIDYSGHWNEKLTMNDDGDFFFRQLIHADKIVFCEETHVLYRIPEDKTHKLSTLNSLSKANSLIDSWKIIEALYIENYKETNAAYLNKKKKSVYFEVKRHYPQLIAHHKLFFSNEIKADNLLFKWKKLKKRIRVRIKYLFRS